VSSQSGSPRKPRVKTSERKEVSPGKTPILSGTRNEELKNPGELLSVEFPPSWIPEAVDRRSQRVPEALRHQAELLILERLVRGSSRSSNPPVPTRTSHQQPKKPLTARAAIRGCSSIGPRAATRGPGESRSRQRVRRYYFDCWESSSSFAPSDFFFCFFGGPRSFFSRRPRRGPRASVETTFPFRSTSRTIGIAVTP